MAQLLIVEDDRSTAWALQRAVTRMGHTVVARVASAAEAMAVVQADRPDGVLLDIGLTGPQDGLLVGLDIQTFWSTPVIYLSGSTPTALGLPEFPEALWCYVAKPIDWHQLRDLLAQLFPPPLGGEDPSHPLVRSRRVWTSPALHERLRHLRQPVASLARSWALHHGGEPSRSPHDKRLVRAIDG
jgi:DNA-binding NtrC family response regulator